jgi:hypothetical protein
MNTVLERLSCSSPNVPTAPIGKSGTREPVLSDIDRDKFRKEQHMQLKNMLACIVYMATTPNVDDLAEAMEYIITKHLNGRDLGSTESQPDKSQTQRDLEATYQQAADNMLIKTQDDLITTIFETRREALFQSYNKTLNLASESDKGYKLKVNLWDKASSDLFTMYKSKGRKPEVQSRTYDKDFAINLPLTNTNKGTNKGRPNSKLGTDKSNTTGLLTPASRLDSTLANLASYMWDKPVSHRFNAYLHDKSLPIVGKDLNNDKQVEKGRKDAESHFGLIKGKHVNTDSKTPLFGALCLASSESKTASYGKSVIYFNKNYLQKNAVMIGLDTGMSGKGTYVFHGPKDVWKYEQRNMCCVFYKRLLMSFKLQGAKTYIFKLDRSGKDTEPETIFCDFSNMSVANLLKQKRILDMATHVTFFLHMIHQKKYRHKQETSAPTLEIFTHQNSEEMLMMLEYYTQMQTKIDNDSKLKDQISKCLGHCYFDTDNANDTWPIEDMPASEFLTALNALDMGHNQNLRDLRLVYFDNYLFAEPTVEEIIEVISSSSSKKMIWDVADTILVTRSEQELTNLRDGLQTLCDDSEKKLEELQNKYTDTVPLDIGSKHVPSNTSQIPAQLENQKEQVKQLKDVIKTLKKKYKENYQNLLDTMETEVEKGTWTQLDKDTSEEYYEFRKKMYRD